MLAIIFTDRADGINILHPVAFTVCFLHSSAVPLTNIRDRHNYSRTALIFLCITIKANKFNRISIKHKNFWLLQRWCGDKISNENGISKVYIYRQPSVVPHNDGSTSPIPNIKMKFVCLLGVAKPVETSQQLRYTIKTSLVTTFYF